MIYKMFLNIGWESKKNTFMELQKQIKRDVLKTYTTESDEETFLNSQKMKSKRSSHLRMAITM